MDPITHFEIPAKNLDNAQKFYSTCFGWQFQAMPEMGYVMVSTTPTGENQMPTTPGAINGGMFQPDTPGSDHPLLVVQVDDIDAKVKTIEGAGGKVVLPVNNVGDMGRYARVSDPEGRVIGLWQNLQG